MRQFLSLSEDGYLPTDGITGGEIPTTKRPPEGIEGFGPGVKVSQSTLQLSDGGEGDARGVGHHGLGETGPLTEFPELHSKAVLERFICHQAAGLF